MAPGAGGFAGLAAEPAGEVVGVFKTGAVGDLADGERFEEGLLGEGEAFLVAEGTETEAVFAFEASAEGIAHVAGVLGDLGEGAALAEAGAHAFDHGGGRGGQGGGGGASWFQEAGDHGDDGGVVGEHEPSLGGDFSEEAVEFVQGVLGEATMKETAGGPAFFVVEHKAEWPTVAGGGVAVGHARWDDEQIAGVGLVAFIADDLAAFAGEEKDELGEVVGMGGDLGFAVSVEL